MAKQAAAERSAAFVPNAPGSFVTISNKTGVLLLSMSKVLPVWQWQEPFLQLPSCFTARKLLVTPRCATLCRCIATVECQSTTAPEKFEDRKRASTECAILSWHKQSTSDLSGWHGKLVTHDCVTDSCALAGLFLMHLAFLHQPRQL
jgi:hypothetical protein